MNVPLKPLITCLRLAWPWRLVLVTAGLLLGLFAGGYFWLAIPDSTGFYLTLQVVAALLLVAAAGWLYAALVRVLAARGEGEERSVRKLWCTPCRNGLKGTLVLVGLAVVNWLVAELAAVCANEVWKIPSWLTYHLNRPVHIAPFVTATGVVFAFLEWGVTPAFATMLLAGRLGGGWWRGRGLGRNFFCRWKMWLATAVVLIVLVWLPWQLAQWVPIILSGTGQLMSVVARFGVAWLLGTLGLMLLIAVWSGEVGAGPAADAE